MTNGLLFIFTGMPLFVFETFRATAVNCADAWHYRYHLCFAMNRSSCSGSGLSQSKTALQANATIQVANEKCIHLKIRLRHVY